MAYDAVHTRHHRGNSDRKDDTGDTIDWVSIYRHSHDHDDAESVWAYTFFSYIRDDPFAIIKELKVKDEKEAVALANGTDYGLGAGLWTRDVQRAHRVAKNLHAGMIWINSYKRVHPASPFGGFGQSGYGREMGFEVMREYTQVKSIWLNVDAEIPPFYKR